MFDPRKFKPGGMSQKTASQRVTEWVKAALPPPIRTALDKDPAHVLINVREVQCGDPSCSPIDIAIALLFRNSRRAMTGMPMRMDEATQADVFKTMGELAAELMACHDDRPWTDPLSQALPPLSDQGNAALETIAKVLNEQLMPLRPDDIRGVCALAMDLLEQIEDDAVRARAPQYGARTQPVPAALDPNTKILAAAQRNDAAEVRRFLSEGVSASYANSLGQTPCHIAAMWGNAEALQVLLEAGANADAQNQLSNASPLHVAAASNRSPEGRLRCAEMLLARGADPRLRDSDGMAPYERVQDPESVRLAEVLKRAFDNAAP
mmetsp:Transcript_13036/g.38837  ORF Transcript_13036/g.38837 Transcript_13036/m.38837 type:complete len:322 (+) Transcript_13036:175-1140(+)